MGTTNTNHTIKVGDVDVQIDERDDGRFGFGYRIGDRTYTFGGFETAAAAERAAPRDVARTLARLERYSRRSYR